MSKDWPPEFRSRRAIFSAVGGLVFVGLSTRLAELQLFRSAEFREEAEEVQIRLDPAPAPRGVIYDRTGKILAGSKRNFYVTIRPERAASTQAIEATLERLSEIVPISDGRRKSILRDAASKAGFLDILVADDLTWEQFSQVNVLAPELDNSDFLAPVNAEVGELRSYPFLGAFYHTVGYVQKANERDIERVIEEELKLSSIPKDSPDAAAIARQARRLYKHPQMRVGKQGLEYYAETALKGTAGATRAKFNASGRLIAKLDNEGYKPKPGQNQVLTLDAHLQTYAINRFGGEAGSAVMIDVATGEVVMMVSTPSPDPNEFVSGISQTSYDALRNDEKNPLYHKAYDGTYPPGSTFKTIVAAAALESGAMSPDERIRCSGKAWYYTRYYNCWRPQGHGMMNMHDGLKHSCDCYFYACAQRTGIEAIADMAKRFGLGHRYELGITGGRSGIVGNNDWKMKTYNERWYDGDTISAGIGQGYMTASPFQLAVMCARIAGGGTTPPPRLVASGVSVPDPTVIDLGDLKPETLDIVRGGMHGVTSEAGGTAYYYLNGGQVDPNGELPAPYTGCNMAGKSGTAQVRVITAAERDSRGRAISNDKLPWKLRDHAWFIAFAPYDKPRYAVSVLLEHGVSGSGAAAPIARDLLHEALKYDTGAKSPFVPKSGEVASSTPPTEAT
ncbi:MAG: penicillin-binding protein 2 [Hyphomonadaceae bacterium]